MQCRYTNDRSIKVFSVLFSERRPSLDLFSVACSRRKWTWRWCFYINLPFGGVALALVAYLLHVPDRDSTQLPLLKKVLQLDLYGITFLLPAIICLTLALQWGGSTYPVSTWL
jgi:hypothetical protein